MRQVWTAAALTALLIAPPAVATQPSRPITHPEPDAIDVAKTPVTDLNLDKANIPPLLKAAVSQPYTLTGIKTCPQIAKAVEELGAVLGPDVDLPASERDTISAGRVAKWAVGSLIPFRGLIREVSGANAQEQALLAAVRAGVARRSFLKGVGQAKRCHYPASPATPAVVQAHTRAQERDGKSATDSPSPAAREATTN